MSNFKYFKGYSNVISITTVTVQGDTRTIRATWTPEMAQDIEAFHGIDVEQELTNMLAREISQEIDNQIFDNIVFPITRRIFARTIGEDLVAVQPLEPPRGLLYFIDLKYDENILHTFKYGR